MRVLLAVNLTWFIKALKYTVVFSFVTAENGYGSSPSHYSKNFLASDTVEIVS